MASIGLFLLYRVSFATVNRFIFSFFTNFVYFLLFLLSICFTFYCFKTIVAYASLAGFSSEL